MSNKTSNKIFEFKSPFVTKQGKNHVSVVPLPSSGYQAWLKKQDAHTGKVLANASFKASPADVYLLHDKDSALKAVLVGIETPCTYHAFAAAAGHVRKSVPAAVLKETTFGIETDGLKADDALQAHIGWGLSGYKFSAYKKNDAPPPSLLPAKTIDKKRVLSFCKSVFMVRNLVNTPANDLGPDGIEEAARHVADTFEADITVISGKKLEKEFPLIHTVGAANPRPPRLIDIQWGKASDPALTLVGKGVAFDTGGLNLKPGQYMKLMKKDMGGAAHALGVAWLVMSMKLPVRLRVLVPAVENSVGGESFRPGDVIKSRKGVFVENTNTDAEGRLILADSLTYASEEKPDLIIDFATLTGSARAALGHDIPACFSNSDKVAEKIKKISFKVHDPVWPMPLWQPYRKVLESSVGDIVNSASQPGDLIYSALFLETFLNGKPDWIHLDVFSWETSGKPGRPSGGAETGLFAVFAYLEARYGG